MTVWYDACTGKHVRYGVAIARHLRKLGNEVILTTRKHPDTLPLAKFLNEKFVVIGQYNPESLLTRMEESLERQLSFLQMFKEKMPKIAISHGSVDQCRVAFGLGIPVVTTIDAPHADAVNRLTLPLSNFIVASKAISEKILQTYTSKAKIVSFDGVDEVAWIRDFEPKVKYDFGKPLIVVRQLEEKAVYTKETVDFIALAKKLTRLGSVVFLSRYHKKTIRDLTIPKGFIESTSLVAQADLFIGAGGTITREAALQGIPAIIVDVFQNQYVNDFLAEKGFPIFRAKSASVPKLAEKLLGKKRDVKHLLAKFENPVDIIGKLMKEISAN